MEKLQRKLKTVDIHGKKYIEVKERILALVENESPYSIETNYEYIDSRKMWIVKAKLTMLETGEVFTGLAQETEDDKTSMVNKTSALENAETSAVGRACAFAGIGVIDSIASADEVNKAINREYRQDTPTGGTKPRTLSSPDEGCPECGKFCTPKKGTTKEGKPYELSECTDCNVKFFINRKDLSKTPF